MFQNLLMYAINVYYTLLFVWLFLRAELIDMSCDSPDRIFVVKMLSIKC